MRRLSLTIIVLLSFFLAKAQSPHGESLVISCAECHNPSGWEIDRNSITFDHSDTGFELEGTHDQLDCTSCHSDLVFDNAPNDCISCHLDVHQQSVGNDCVRCHNSDSWLVFNIPELHEQNGFPLIGAHSDVDCASCHNSATTLTFTPLGNECIQCHQQDYLSTTSPNHATSGFSTDCLECHNPMGIDWESTGFNHDFFPLTLGHDINDCSACHDVGNFSNISPECVSCHQQDYAQTTDPNHVAANFPNDCVQCHTTNPGWMPALFDHEFFPLTLGHDIDDCTACHINNNYINTPTDCYACHQNDYAGSVNPNHVAANFPTDCVVCHTTNPGWAPASLDHNFFPLTLGHDVEDCTSCHINNNYIDTPTECVACHLNDFNATTDPNHIAANFPTDCAVCHTTNPGWIPATLNHSFFPLTLGHDLESCTACHINNDYVNTPTECVACHLNDYNTTTDPNHVAANFPTDCAVCHTTNPGWMPATFNHDGLYFPIYSGAHEGEWNNCIDCHINTSNYSVFTCVTCHTQNDMDDDHSDVSGYIYESNACLSCHPNP